jgi:hypothetical protein
MWDKDTSDRFQQLRRKEQVGDLTDDEQQELSDLTDRLEAMEAAYLGPATERLRHDRERLEAQNSGLAAIVHRKEELVRRLQIAVEEARSEQQAIDDELARILKN